ncbi:glycoside hydrolase family 16 protein [Hypholoma sublateritium FD-334 SS-4]|uniref:Glycoside hydrolase family 16 protein n=1 Tax=Hypholoma sublateritium (strain FD-334 SS-4) TaxID=945553 RepID=A0A0D2LP40_HYPSF|nr:glycoside hydrolase family 16 protein [Hypholoma sublateritium FD-334 SS-4]
MSHPGSPHPGYASADSSLVIPRSSSFGVLRRDSWQSLSESPYSFGAGSRLSATLSENFSLPADPRLWGSDLSPDLIEPDDDLHNPTFDPDKIFQARGKFQMGSRGLLNVGCLSILLIALIILFIGYPIMTYNESWAKPGLGAINSTGQAPSIGNFGLIDIDTPYDAYVKASIRDGSQMQLVFSDEFNTDGRTFYPGDDPYWEAEDLHYWATNNMEWYDPEAITTAEGSLVITFSEKQTHGLDYEGGLMSTWNKFCFTGGYIEVSVQLPGTNNVMGMWPAVWTMGNLGRAGYGATLEGMWPYTYDTCDVGTAPNQTLNGQPLTALTDGDHAYGGVLSYLPGQRLSRCTCGGESHPGPMHADGTYVGRSAPEIDVFEAQIGADPPTGEVSQSAQWAPFNRAYLWDNSSDNEILGDPTISSLNTFTGNAEQQATSVVTNTNQRCYELYISWVADGMLSWTLNVAGMAADPTVDISARPVPQEPMYIIVNLGMSKNFGNIDFDHLVFPTQMRVDYIRVYQDANAINIGCNPETFPTEDYINQFVWYIEAYTNPNLTTWREDFGQPFPKNKFIESC